MNQTQRENDTAKERRLKAYFPFDLGLKLPEDDSLHLLIEITKEMDFRELYSLVILYIKITEKKNSSPVITKLLFPIDFNNNTVLC